MAARNLSELLDFEGAFERAAQTILDGLGFETLISQANVKAPLIYVKAYADLGPAIDELTILPLGGQTTQQQQDFFRYTLMLTTEVSVPRDTAKPAADAGVTSFLAQARAQIRAAFMMSQWPFQDSNTPFVRVSEIRPMGTSTGFLQPRNCDMTTLRFQITFAIQPTAWPAGFPPS